MLYLEVPGFYAAVDVAEDRICLWIVADGRLARRADLEMRRPWREITQRRHQIYPVHIAGIAAGHFDHFICRCDDNRRGRGEEEVATMLKNRLLEDGISADRIEVVPDEQEANRRALEMAEIGDLVLMFGDNIKRTWKQIIYFNSGSRVDTGGKNSATTIDLPSMAEFNLDNDVEIISDERGVRIAREEGD